MWPTAPYPLGRAPRRMQASTPRAGRGGGTGRWPRSGAGSRRCEVCWRGRPSSRDGWERRCRRVEWSERLDAGVWGVNSDRVLEGNDDKPTLQHLRNPINRLLPFNNPILSPSLVPVPVPVSVSVHIPVPVLVPVLVLALILSSIPNSPSAPLPSPHISHRNRVNNLDDDVWPVPSFVPVRKEGA
ncbi:hypothetical protein BC936DRAFT_141640 [Jimgerdemannia flammicorona]|uniref:Uncharacterized protein n=1 Tax=Jimgerdemannia flammicorona TaxID=994334 RepID=A0A433A1W4_9FUNG|nr:hypothetical protein BC936DRAFT_141640 [Jimgerdemannia flammicorona]